jgi:c(7)-type cytochrome triheme protein
MTGTRRSGRAWLILGTATIAIGLAFASLLGGSARARDAEPKVRYSHEKHDQLKVNQKDCRQCHVLNDSFEVLPATLGKNHQPCNNADCHASEYFSREPRICVVCHDATDPNVKQPAVVRRRPGSEFGGDLSHKSHLKMVKGRGSGKNAVCKACHGDVFKGEAPVASGHAGCSTCHGKSASPAMGACGECHSLGGRRAASSPTAGDWSVSAMFTHASHANDPRASRTETDCTECHAKIPEATNLGQVSNPEMKSCDGCHNGANAFKTTGFACYRCHATEGAPGR